MRVKGAARQPEGAQFLLVQFIDQISVQRFIHSVTAERASTSMMRHTGYGERGKVRASGRDKAIDLHCQSEEAINKSVTIKRERGRVWRSESRVYKRNTTKPGAMGASSCRALMGVRSGWFSILCLMAHSSADGPRHPWRNATHLFNPVSALKGDSVEVKIERKGDGETDKRLRNGQRSSQTWILLSTPSRPHLLTHSPSLSSAPATPLRYYCHRVAVFPYPPSFLTFLWR